jgi:hypothetical protein
VNREALRRVSTALLDKDMMISHIKIIMTIEVERLNQAMT